MSLLAINLDGGQTDAGLSLLPYGALFTGSGILRPTAFAASEQLSPGMAVDISGSSDDDIAVIKTSDGSTYVVKNTSTVAVTILANASGVTKTDAIVLYVDLAGGDPDNAGSPGAAHLIAVRRAGVSTGAPTDGEIDAATSNNPWMKLHEVNVEHGTGEIEDTDLTDVRLAAWFQPQMFGTEHIPGSALSSYRLPYQTDNANSISSTSGTAVKLQAGWAQMVGSGSQSMNQSISFPTSFTTLLGIMVTFVGVTGADTTPATSITDFEASLTAFSASAHAQNPSTTGFTAVLTVSPSNTFSTTRYYGYSWIAWGL